MLPEGNHIIQLQNCGLRRAPWRGCNPQPFCRKKNCCFIRTLVVPISNEYIFWYHIDRTVSVIQTRLPHTEPRSLAIDQPITPDPELAIFLRKMIADLRYF